MTEIQNVAGTAFIVAQLRAAELAQARPLYRDTVVPLFLGPDTEAAAARFSKAFPPMEKTIRLRTRYFDDCLDEELERGCSQVVILGAGLDTRAIRKQRPRTLYFEIDDGATLNFKKAQLEANYNLSNIKFISADYVTDGLTRLLAQNGFDTSRRTHFIWEGNTMYLTEESIRQTFLDIADNVKEFTLSFDYMTDAVIAKTTGDPAVTRLAESFAAMGAPWTYGFASLRKFFYGSGLKIVSDVKIGELHCAFWPGEPLDSAIYEHYHLCTLESQRVE
jgi:methyltransferase (TIGR00027 family)